MATPSAKDNCLAEAHGESVPLSGSLWELLSQGVEENPDGFALISTYQPSSLLSSLLTSPIVENDDQFQWTYSQLQHGAEILASALKSQGLGKGSVLAVLLWNSAEWVVLFWAAAKLKATFAALDPRSIERSVEACHLLDTLKPDMLVVHDSISAKQLKSLAEKPLESIGAKIICSSDSGTEIADWHDLNALISQQVPHGEQPTAVLETTGEGSQDSTDHVALVLFTSGTTGPPKGCPHKASNLRSATSLYRSVRLLRKENRFLLHNPCFHVMATQAMLCAWRAGATVIFPSRRFDAGATLKNIEGCTHLSCSPSMVYAMLNHHLFPSKQPNSLEYLGVGAELISEDMLKHFQKALKAKFAASGWGMTEGHGVVFWSPRDIVKSKDGALGVGKVMPGGKVRICAPGTHQVLQIGEIGELHCGGSTIISGYLNAPQHESFYTDVSGKWFMTGDQALMDDSGVIYILGRYKDIIIRGGENISPHIIEACLNRHSGSKSQVIGIPDPVQGEVPYAVLKRAPKSQVSGLALRESVVSDLGTHQSLAGLVFLDDLGLDEFPLTTSGKVHKNRLKEIVREHSKKQEKSQSTTASHGVVEIQVKETWSRLLGIPIESLISTTSIQTLADSLTVLKFAYEMETRFGLTVSSAEVLDNPLIGAQIELIQGKKSPAMHEVLPYPRETKGPPSIEEMVHTHGNSSVARRTAEDVAATLRPLGLDWDRDVEAVMPVRDLLCTFLRGSRQRSDNIRWAHHVKGVDHFRIRHVVEALISHDKMLRTVYAESETHSLHVVIRPSPQWFGLCIRDEFCVDNAGDVIALVNDDTLGWAGSLLPSPLLRIAIIKMKETGRFALMTTCNHSIFDAFSMASFFNDFDGALNQTELALPKRLDYKYFADLYYLHRCGPAASIATRYQVDRLQGIGGMKNTLWPRKRFSQRSFEEIDGGRKFSEAREGRKNSSADFQGTSWYYRAESFPSLQRIKSEFGIEAPTMVKAALALCNSQLTGEPHAIFSNLDAGRQWPFVEPWIAERLPNPMHIAGPTLGGTINSIPIHGTETALDFLCRVHQEQALLTLHVHAPFDIVAEQLTAAAGGGTDLLPLDEIWRRQVFSWDPSLKARVGPNPYKNLEPIQRRGWMAWSVFWNMAMLDEERLFVLIVYDESQLTEHEAREAFEVFISKLRWLTEPGNWAKLISECK